MYAVSRGAFLPDELRGSIVRKENRSLLERAPAGDKNERDVDGISKDTILRLLITLGCFFIS